MFSHLTQISFADRWVLWLIPVTVVLAGLWWYFRERKQYPSLKISSVGSLLRFGNPVKSRIKKMLPALRVLTLILLLVAIARPQTLHDEEKVNTEGIDIVIALDVSTSMLAKDFTPNRLASAKNEALRFVDERPHDRIGMVIFAGESFTQCPVTIDHAVVKEQIEKVKNGVLEDGTAIGMGLATAVQRLRESKGKSKVVILMTDGVNNRGSINPLTAADIAMSFGVRVYTIGMGTNGQAMTPVAMTPDGKLVYDYAPVEIDEPLLKQIAQKTGGQYFRATDSQKLKEIYNQIDKLEKTKIQVSAYQHKAEKFHAFALFGGLLVLLEMLFRYFIVRSWP